MAERVKTRMCANCVHFQKENPIVSGSMVLYRCSSQKRGGRCIGWCPEHILPKHMGCSCYNKLYPGDRINLETVLGTKCQYLYLGIVGKHFKKGLFYLNKYLTEPKGQRREGADKYRVMEKGDFDRYFKNVHCVLQNEAQLEASRRVAKKRKARWLENVKTCTAL